MATVADLKAGVVDSVRRVRLEEKRLRAWALAFDAGQLDLSDLATAAVRYGAEVRVYREYELALLAHGVTIPKAVREGGTTSGAWEPIEDGEVTMPCHERQGGTLQ